jgi:hypothetical protein
VADNTQLNIATTAGDFVRNIQKGGAGGPKSSVCIIDISGAGVEVLLTAGQALMAASVPVVIASNQTAIPITDAGGSLTVDGTVTANVGTTGGLALDATLTGGTQVAQAVGNVAAGSADSGAPVKLGGKISTSIPGAGTNANRVDAYFDAQGRLGVHIGSGTISATVNTGVGGDGSNFGSTPSLQIGGALHNYNGAFYDRARNNHETTVLASAARTAAINSADQTNFNARTLYLTWDITAAGTGTLTLTIKYKDSLSGKYVTLLASAAQTGVGTVTLKVGPDLTAAANTVAKEALPRVWRAEVTGADGSSWTYSCSANYTN